MSTVKNTNSFVRSISRMLLMAVLLTAVCPISAYAAADNPELSTLEAFPAIGESTDTMNVNLGTIVTLYDGGIVNDNRGHISSSGGIVAENHGSIESLIAGHVGTNNGTIDRIENSGVLTVNDKDGTVLFVCMGNVVERNDGTIRENAGYVNENFGTVSNNYGTVVMHDGLVVNNDQYGKVVFEAKITAGETIPAKGGIELNKGSVTINSGNVSINTNTGNIVITNANVTVGENTGTIILGANAVLSCGVNNGRIIDETAARYKIVFSGDDGKAKIEECDLEIDGVYYTLAGGGVIFTLPPEYECSDARKLESGEVNTWGLNANPAEGDTEFTIVCRKLSPCDLLGHSFTHYISNGDAGCTADGTKTAVCDNGCGAADTIADPGSAKGHRYGEWVTVRDATETETGERVRSCSACGDTDKEVIPVLPHSHKGTLQSGTSASCTAAGVKDCYSCTCGKSFEDAACSIEIADMNAWKDEGGNGYIAPAGHSFNTYISNDDASCTTDGTKTAVCDNGCGAADTVADPGSAKGHRFGEWVTVKEPSLTETGERERRCSVCGAKETEEIPVLIPAVYSIISGANSVWTKGSTYGLAFTSDAPFDKFVGVRIDGVTVDPAYYTAEPGSTRVTVSPACLGALATGIHSVEIVSADGTASAIFTVKAAQPIDPTVPQTGDNSRLFLWIALLLVSSVALAGTVLAGKKRKKAE